MTLTPDRARVREDARRAFEARALAACRRDFLTNPEHGAVCVDSPPCSRDYEACPYPESDPWPPAMYAGTGVGALYGIGRMTGRQAASLAGWNVTCGGRQEVGCGVAR